MDKKWEELTPEEKREERFNKWLGAAGVVFASPEAEKAYKERVTRLGKAIRGEEPDRVPCMLPAGSFAVYYAGSTTYKVMYDTEEAVRVWRKFRQDFETDTSTGAGVGIQATVMDRMDYKLMKWPGHGLSTDSTGMQFVEGEYMKADEYDAMLDDPSDFLAQDDIAPYGRGAGTVSVPQPAQSNGRDADGLFYAVRQEGRTGCLPGADGSRGGNDGIGEGGCRDRP